MDQFGLFDLNSQPDRGETLLLGDAALVDFPTAFDHEKSQLLFDRLYQDIPWRQESLWIGGKRREVPRLQCWMGDKASLYGYSGMRLQPVAWHSTVLEIRRRAEELSQCSFNSVLLNLYRDGLDSVAWHADDEAELGDDPVIASVSLGAERPFQLKSRQSQPPEKHQIWLKNGSILVMGKGIQSRWLHQLPKVKSLKKTRINLTFRQVQKLNAQA